MSNIGYSATTISDYSIVSQENNGAMGDVIPIESSMFFADDECDNNSMVVLPRRDNVCVRCKTALETRARLCRTCYNARRTWMPIRPTRKLRRKLRRPSYRLKSIPIRYRPTISQEGSSDLFLRGNKTFTKINKPPNLLYQSSESSSDFKRGRLNEVIVEEILNQIFSKMSLRKIRKYRSK
ncbi:hypothetical protein O3M35_012287 [Rhynocoris fuscipes]|uniref:Uncharacterized protein n=1 Tax=Rhynocoris fuscipes TaxID=488301 RepID=A0AAW1CUE0_9HEMI